MFPFPWSSRRSPRALAVSEERRLQVSMPCTQECMTIEAGVYWDRKYHGSIKPSKGRRCYRNRVSYFTPERIIGITPKWSPSTGFSLAGSGLFHARRLGYSKENRTNENVRDLPSGGQSLAFIDLPANNRRTQFLLRRRPRPIATPFNSRTNLKHSAKLFLPVIGATGLMTVGSR